MSMQPGDPAEGQTVFAVNPARLAMVRQVMLNEATSRESTWRAVAEEQREELDGLRAQVRDLTVELETLRGAAGDPSVAEVPD